MGKSGYTSLSLEEKRYAKLRRNFDTTIDTDKTFTIWATDVLEAAINREGKITTLFPGLKFIGHSSKGVIIQDHSEIVQITTGSGSKFTCDKDKGLCKHILFTALHPLFEFN